MTTKNICIYSGPGASKENIHQMQVALIKSGIPDLSIKLVNHTKIEQTHLKGCDLFVIAGGRDRLYSKYLNGRCNNIIKNYVKLGGAFLGICAGAYYAGTKVEFAKGSDKEVIEDRELGFFKGSVIGPVLCDYFYNSTKGTTAAKINIDDQYSYVHYNGGGYFQGNDKSVEVISYYQDLNPLLPAIIKIKEHKGLVILSGVHFEYCNSENYLYTKKENIDLLKKYNKINIKLFNKLITMLLNKMWF